MLKAQCYQESLLNPLAVSHVGAYGLCQFMPRTAADVSRKLGVSTEEFWLPAVSIRAAGYYMGNLMRSWKAERPFLDRIKLSQASYNAGIGNVLKAQSYCDNARLYDEIIPCLPKVTGKRNSKETIGYVDYIVNRWYPRMLLE
jgi:soluble lytic murein transglycosylase-like protein